MKLEVPSFGLSTELHHWGRFDKPALNGLVALHGFTGTGLDFAPLTTATAEWDGQWAAPDLPGHGSCEADPACSFSFAATDALILRALAQLNASKRFLLGYSMGGRLALHCALRHHPQIEGLILIGSSPGIKNLAAREQRRNDDARLAQQLLDDDIDAFMDRWEALPILRSQERIAPNWRTAMSARRRSQRPPELARALRELGTGAMPDLWPEIPNFRIPLDLVIGREDVKFLKVARSIAALNPLARIIEIPEAGHCPHLENPSAFLHYLRRRLNS